MTMELEIEFIEIEYLCLKWIVNTCFFVNTCFYVFCTCVNLLSQFYWLCYNNLGSLTLANSIRFRVFNGNRFTLMFRWPYFTHRDSVSCISVQWASRFFKVCMYVFDGSVVFCLVVILSGDLEWYFG